MISRETLINEAILDIIVPTSNDILKKDNIETLFTEKSRTQIFYDELLYLYLVISLPEMDSNIIDKSIAKTFFKQLEINFEASLIESSNSNNIPTTPQQSSNRFLTGKSRSNSVASIPPGSPKLKTLMGFDPINIFSTKFKTSQKDRQAIIVEHDNCWKSVWTISLPISYVKTRFTFPALALNSTISLLPFLETPNQMIKKSKDDMYDINNFGRMNLLAGLCEDPTFESEDINFHMPQTQVTESRRQSIYPKLTPTKHTCQKILSLKNALNVRMRTIGVSPQENSLMILVSLENKDEDTKNSFLVESIKIDIPNSFVTRYEAIQDGSTDKLPLTLKPIDQVSFLYNVSILETPSLPKPSPPQHHRTPSNSESSSRRNSVASIFSNHEQLTKDKDDEEDDDGDYNNTQRQRPFLIFVKGSPIIDQKKVKSIESKWNCTLDLSSLLRRDNSIMKKKRPVSFYSKYGSSRNSITTLPSNGFSTPSSTSTIKNCSSTTPSTTSTRSRSSTITSANSTTKNYYSTMLNNFYMMKNKQTLNSNLSDSSSIYSESTTIVNNSNNNNGILFGGRAPMIEDSFNEMTDIEDSVTLSFSINSEVAVGKIFSVRAFIVNKSKYTRKFSIIVPNKKRSQSYGVNKNSKVLSSFTSSSKLSSESRNRVIQPFMDESEFLNRHLEYETPAADLVCLDNKVQIGPIHPLSSESVALRFIATKESLYPIELVQLVDIDSGCTTNIRNVLEILVPGTLISKSSKCASRNIDVTVLKHVVSG
ncbi:hypothetical protein Glove_40g23 [Diversispora epigaea]|uniref:Trafficking protein particle complex II-specific subunit 65 IgD3 domain-containing protein n=1 Tax=Diversispora epigaea TaxID=1348612 RepID=A0A397JJY2_9GLOM|nr:hypothetical protein Glove_40g23 [Diversispora epigaea]